MKKRLLISSLATIGIFSSLTIGGTFALFTSESTTNINVSSAKVNYTTEISNIKLYSMGRLQEGNTFENGGTATYDPSSNVFNITNITPGDKITFDYTIRNNSNVKTVYRVKHKKTGGSFLLNALKFSGYDDSSTNWRLFDIPGSDEERVITHNFSLELPEDTENKVQGKTITHQLILESRQATAFTIEDEAPLEIDEANKVVNIKGYRGYFEFIEHVNKRSSIWDDATKKERGFFGYTVNLLKDINLYNNQYDVFKPIGTNGKVVFEGTFDGHGHTISNFDFVKSTSQGGGIFGVVSSSASIKNLNVKNINVSTKLYAGSIVGMGASTNITNCHVIGDIKISSQSYSGGLIGGNPGNLTNCSVIGSNTSSISSSGSYAGGIYGIGSSGSFTFNDLNTDIDVTANAYVGGLGGSIYSQNIIDNCHIKGTIRNTYKGTDNKGFEYGIGGLIGTHVYREGPEFISIIKNSSFEGTLINDFDLNTDRSTLHDGLIGGGHYLNPDLIIENLDISTNNKVTLK